MIAFLYDLIITIPISIISFIISQPYFGIENKNEAEILVFVLTVFLCAGINNVSGRYKWLTMLVPVGIFGAVVFSKEPANGMAVLSGYQWLIYAFVLGIVAFLIERLVVSNRWFFRLMIVGLAVYLIYNMYHHIMLNKVLVGMTMYLLLVALAEELQRRWKKNGRTDMKYHITFIFPFILIPALIVTLSSSPKDPYGWDFVVKIWRFATQNVKWAYSMFSDGDKIWENKSGLTETGYLTGNIEDDGKKILEVNFERFTENNLYLTAYVYDTFDGRNWTITYNEDNNNYILDTITTFGAAYRYGDSLVRNYVRECWVRVSYDVYSSQLMFVPLKARIDGMQVSDIPISQSGENISFNSKVGYETSYVVSYYMLNRKYEYFDEIFDETGVLPREVFNYVRSKYFYTLAADLEYEDYLSYRDDMYEYYLDEVVLSDRMQAYMDELLEGAENDYEKVLRIKSIFDDFTYNDNPGEIPKDVITAADYLDYFIFEKKDGFCVYYATAFVLLARAEGIPARYVQGLYLNGVGRDKTDVTTSMIHAWPEVYIDGFGWLRMEPTPGYNTESGWTVIENTDEESTVSTNQVQPEEIQPPVSVSENIPSPVINNPAPKDLEEDADGSTGINRNILIIIGCVIAVMIFIILLIIKISNIIWYKKLDERTKYTILCRRAICILELLEYSMKPGETLEEFEKRLPTNSMGETIELFKEYEKVSYSDLEVNHEMLDRAKEAVKKLFILLRGEKKSLYFVYKMRIERKEKNS